MVACSRRPDFPTETDRLLLGVGTNQTAIVLQRKRAERSLADERERLRITLASIGDAVIATDAEGRVTFMNGVAESLTGWPPGRGRGAAAARGLPHRQRAHPPAGREPGPARPAGGGGRRAGEPHRPHRQGRDGAAHRRQRRPDPGRAGARRAGPSWSSGTSPSAGGPSRSSAERGGADATSSRTRPSACTGWGPTAPSSGPTGPSWTCSATRARSTSAATSPSSTPTRP